VFGEFGRDQACIEIRHTVHAGARRPSKISFDGTLHVGVVALQLGGPSRAKLFLRLLRISVYVPRFLRNFAVGGPIGFR
jgi:hypothetical protein